MQADRLGPILRPLFKNIKELFKELIQGDVVLSFRKGPSGKVEDIKSVLWNKAFGCRVGVDNLSEDSLFLIMEKNGGIFLSAKLLLLPQSNIDALMKKGEVNESILDAQKEIFNMLVGKLNDVLMEKVQKDIHLVMNDNFIVDEKDLSLLPAEKEFVTYTANVKMAGPVTFSMSIIFSSELANLIIKHISPDEEDDLSAQPEATTEEEKVQREEDDSQEQGKESVHKASIKPFKIPSSVKKGSSDFYIEYIMEEDFPVAQLGTSLWNAVNTMQKYGMDFIILVDGLKFIGLLTMADIRRGLSPFLEEPFRDYCREQDLATKNFQVDWFLEREIAPVPYEASLEEVLDYYLKQDFPYLPVCKNKRIVGVITHTKLVNYLAALLYGEVDSEESAESTGKLVTNASS